MEVSTENVGGVNKTNSKFCTNAGSCLLNLLDTPDPECVKKRLEATELR